MLNVCFSKVYKSNELEYNKILAFNWYKSDQNINCLVSDYDKLMFIIIYN